MLTLVFRDHDPGEGRDRLGFERNASEPRNEQVGRELWKNIIGREGNFHPFYYAPLPLATVFRKVGRERRTLKAE